MSKEANIGLKRPSGPGLGEVNNFLRLLQQITTNWEA